MTNANDTTDFVTFLWNAPESFHAAIDAGRAANRAKEDAGLCKKCRRALRAGKCVACTFGVAFDNNEARCR